MFGWWRRRRLENQMRADIGNWIARHGLYARRLARERSIDAYLLGDLDEQERWGQIRESIPEIEEVTDPDVTDSDDGSSAPRPLVGRGTPQAG